MYIDTLQDIYDFTNDHVKLLVGARASSSNILLNCQMDGAVGGVLINKELFYYRKCYCILKIVHSYKT